jgi:putative pyruvate formate lyase activating enzyme
MSTINSEVIALNITEYESCTLCARGCGVNRYSRLGYCKSPRDVYVTRAALHQWEEPPISGTRGSGTIFFSGCSLGCIFCQNREISRGIAGDAVSEEKLASIMLNLENKGAHNINFVTPTHYAPSIIRATRIAREQGLSIPIVYNTGTYDTVETIKSLNGIVDIYLPDFKYYKSETAEKYSNARDYFSVAKNAIAEMYRQRGKARFDENGIMISGVIVRILLLPGHLAEAKLSLKYLLDTYGDNIYISLMNQYTPTPDMPRPLNRKVTHAEYDELLSYAERLGLKNGFFQDIGTAEEGFIPDFDGTGVK